MSVYQAAKGAVKGEDSRWRLGGDGAGVVDGWGMFGMLSSSPNRLSELLLTVFVCQIVLTLLVLVIVISVRRDSGY